MFSRITYKYDSINHPPILWYRWIHDGSSLSVVHSFVRVLLFDICPTPPLPSGATCLVRLLLLKLRFPSLLVFPSSPFFPPSWSPFSILQSSALVTLVFSLLLLPSFFSLVDPFSSYRLCLRYSPFFSPLWTFRTRIIAK